MTKAVIHIGFGKTGTSSLQAALSSGVLDGTQYEYCTIGDDGSLISGQTLSKHAQQQLHGYVPSTLRPDCIDHDLVRTRIAAICDLGKIPILSQEAWSQLGSVFKEYSLLERWGIRKAHIVAYVRPQVEYLNSGWWQWWAWNGLFEKPADVIKEWGVSFMLWAAGLKPWASMGPVDRLSVRLHGEDTVRDFFCLIGMKDPVLDLPRKNIGMSRELIQLYRTIPGLRTSHDSQMDSILSPLLNASRTPWVISPDLAQQVLDRCREDNIELRAYLSHDQRHQMTEDKRWWSAECYDVAEDVEPLSLSDAISILSKIVPQFDSLLAKKLPRDFALGNANAIPMLLDAVRMSMKRCLRKAKKNLKAHTHE